MELLAGTKSKIFTNSSTAFLFCGFYENFDLSFAFIFYVFQPPVKTQKQAIHAQHSEPKINPTHTGLEGTQLKNPFCSKKSMRKLTRKNLKKNDTTYIQSHHRVVD